MYQRRIQTVATVAAATFRFSRKTLINFYHLGKNIIEIEIRAIYST